MILDMTMIDEMKRYSTGMPDIDKILGGETGNFGLPKGLTLLGGSPGIGKSTLVKQICHGVCYTNPKTKILYAIGEERKQAVSGSLEKLGCSHQNFYIYESRSVNEVCSSAEKVGASVVVVDPIAFAYVDECLDYPGSIAQMKEVVRYLKAWCHGLKASAILLLTTATYGSSELNAIQKKTSADATLDLRSSSKSKEIRYLITSYGATYLRLTGRGFVSVYDISGRYPLSCD